MRLGLSARRPVMPRTWHRVSGRVRFFFVIAVLLFCIGFFFIRIQPAFFSRVSAYAVSTTTDVINQTVSKVFTEDNIQYSDLINLKENGEGKVTSVEANSVKINYLKSHLTEEIQKAISQNGDGYIYIPMGSILQSPLFSAAGPKIKIKLSPASITKVDFQDEFVSTGINQVKHKIYLDVSVKMDLASAAMHTSETVNTSVLIGDTVIVGVVPNYYGEGTGLNVVGE